MNANEPVVVWTSTDPLHAEMVKGTLQSEGIIARLEGASQAGLAGILEVKVLVRAWDADRARRILREHEHCCLDD